MFEKVYYNNGTLYKETDVVQGERTDNCMLHSIYVDKTPDSKYFEYVPPEGMWSFFSVKDGVVKKFYKSPEICEIEASTFLLDSVLDALDVCPAISIKTGLGVKENTTEIYFVIKDFQNMSEIADYYSLPIPIDNTDFDTAEWKWKNRIPPSLGTDVVFPNDNFKIIKAGYREGSIKFTDGVATIFKVYQTTPK
jgi:hypothetical protein